MNRGISVTLNDSDESLLFLRELIRSADDTDEIYIALIDFVGGNEKDFTANATCSKNEFLKRTEQIAQLLFSELFVFPKGAVDKGGVIDYEAFSNSSCKTAILCSDSAYFDVYIKDEKTLTALYDYCKNSLQSTPEIITAQNDGRHVFKVL